MISLDCRVKKYITIFSLLILCQSCFGRQKVVFKSVKSLKTALEKHYALLEQEKNQKNKVGLYFFQNHTKNLKDAPSFINRYYLKKGGFLYLPDLYFANSDGYSFFGDLYYPEADNGNWIDDMLFEIEEERIASEISEMDNTSEDFQYDTFDAGQRSQEIEDALDGSEREIYFYTKDSSLSHMSFDKEILVINKKENGFIGIHANENEIQRIFYDAQYRTERKETWNKDATVNITNQIFEYDEDSIKPAKKIIEKKSESTPKKEIIFYDDGLVSESMVYVIVTDKSEDNSESKREEIISKSNWEYDNEERVIKSIQKNYSYNDSSYSKLTDSFEKKYVYFYHESVIDEDGNEVEIPADTEYYEENILRMRFVYKSKLNYTKQYFFDDDFNVTSYYVDDKLTKEIYRTGKKVLRIKSYDN